MTATSSFTAAALLWSAAFSSGSQFDFDDLLDALGAEFHGHADVEAVNAVLAVEVGGAGQNLLLVFQDRLDHFGSGSGRCVVGASPF